MNGAIGKVFREYMDYIGAVNIAIDVAAQNPPARPHIM